VINWKDISTLTLFLGRIVVVAACGLLPACAVTAQAPDETYAKEAWAYFKKKCETEAGEKIFNTYTGVKNVLVVKSLPPATEKDTACYLRARWATKI